MAVVALIAFAVACERQIPSAPAPPQNSASPNQPPRIVATITPPSGIDHLTTFSARVEVTDPDREEVALTVWGCDFPKDTPVVLNGGAAVLSFKTNWQCGSLVLAATDARGASTRTQASAEHMGLGGRFRLVIGEGFYGSPFFMLNLVQSGAAAAHDMREGRSNSGTRLNLDSREISSNVVDRRVS